MVQKFSERVNVGIGGPIVTIIASLCSCLGLFEFCFWDPFYKPVLSFHEQDIGGQGSRNFYVFTRLSQTGG